MSRSTTRETGAAALIVVLVLFFVISLVAAYTSRSMIFEQRTSVNQFRSTQALEIGDAGVEWALTKLNTGLLGGDCGVDGAGVNTFRQRYLAFDASNRITGMAAANATCSMSPTAGTWACSCPTAGSAIPTTGTGPFPTFRVYFDVDSAAGGARENLIRVFVAACTDAVAGCLASPQIPQAGIGNAWVSALLGLKGAIDTLPAAAVTVPAPSTAASSVLPSGGTKLVAYNNDPRGSAIRAGGVLPGLPDLQVVGAPGMPSELTTVAQDISLSWEAGTGGLRNSSDAGGCLAGSNSVGCSFNRMFASVFGAPRNVYLEQPSLVTCSAGCNSTALAELARRNPGRVIHVTSAGAPVTLDAVLGTAADPVALVVDGDVVLSGAAIVTGLVYATGSTAATAADWNIVGTPRVQGAIVSEKPMTLSGGGTLEVVYSQPVLARLRAQSGSFVRVPGGWRDFPNPTGGP